jgi:hypothetical protein
VSRPRLILVPEFTELQWTIEPLVREWAEVLSFDPPGVGEEPLPRGVGNLGELSHEMVAERGLERLTEAGWGRYFLAADGWAIPVAVAIATRRREAVVGMALGHASLSFARAGERAPINPEVYGAFTQLVKSDAPSFVRYGIAQLTKGGVDEEHAERIIERLPTESMIDGWMSLTSDAPFGEELLELECPLLLAKHEGCLLASDEGFQDAAAAMPHAATVAVDDPPSTSPAFEEALRDFCVRQWERAGSARA